MNDSQVYFYKKRKLFLVSLFRIACGRPESRKAGPGCEIDSGSVCLYQAVQNEAFIVILARARMYFINHWIPAFAGRLRASSAACSRRRSTTYILVGVPSRRIQDFLSINDDGGNRHIPAIFNAILPVLSRLACRSQDEISAVFSANLPGTGRVAILSGQCPASAVSRTCR